MSMYGDRLVNIQALKEWVIGLSLDSVDEVNIAGKILELGDTFREMLEAQLGYLKAAVNNLKEGDDWRELRGICSPMFYNVFFKVGNNAIKIANYYECLVLASDLGTKKKIIKGFVDYLDIGAVNLYDGKEAIGCIGIKSDLIWSVLYDYFVFEDDFGGINHTVPCQEEYMAIQLINVDKMSIEQIEHKVNEILLKCSIELELNFKVVKLDKELRDKGNDGLYGLQVHENEYESEPLMYFNNGIGTEDIRMKYLSYYQVLEYFFNRAQNYKIIDEIKSGDYTTTENINHRELKKILKKYVSTLSERESLKLVLKRGLDITEIKSWINENQKRREQYTSCSVASLNIDLSKSDEKIIGKLAERIYYYRCAIAHAKGDTDEYLAIPEQSDYVIQQEIPLLKLIAVKVLKGCSEI